MCLQKALFATTRFVTKNKIQKKTFVSSPVPNIFNLPKLPAILDRLYSDTQFMYFGGLGASCTHPKFEAIPVLTNIYGWSFEH